MTLSNGFDRPTGQIHRAPNLSIRRAASVLRLVLIAAPLISCGKAETSPQFPPAAANAQPGDLALTNAIFTLDDKDFNADYATLTVPENRDAPEGRRIELPVVRIRSTAAEPAEPIFLLQGGPGVTNIWTRPPSWMLEHHDIVMVGYRGMDGSVSLACPEVGEALVSGRSPLSAEHLAQVGDAYPHRIQAHHRHGR